MVPAFGMREKQLHRVREIRWINLRPEVPQIPRLFLIESTRISAADFTPDGREAGGSVNDFAEAGDWLDVWSQILPASVWIPGCVVSEEFRAL